MGTVPDFRNRALVGASGDSIGADRNRGDVEEIMQQRRMGRTGLKRAVVVTDALSVRRSQGEEIG